MNKPRIFRIINPSGVAWGVRFTTIESAWSRLLGLKKLRDSPIVRKQMTDEGWEIEEA